MTSDDKCHDRLWQVLGIIKRNLKDLMEIAGEICWILRRNGVELYMGRWVEIRNHALESSIIGRNKEYSIHGLVIE